MHGCELVAILAQVHYKTPARLTSFLGVPKVLFLRLSALSLIFKTSRLKPYFERCVRVSRSCRFLRTPCSPRVLDALGSRVGRARRRLRVPPSARSLLRRRTKRRCCVLGNALELRSCRPRAILSRAQRACFVRTFSRNMPVSFEHFACGLYVHATSKTIAVFHQIAHRTIPAT